MTRSFRHSSTTSRAFTVMPMHQYPNSRGSLSDLGVTPKMCFSQTGVRPRIFALSRWLVVSTGLIGTLRGAKLYKRLQSEYLSWETTAGATNKHGHYHVPLTPSCFFKATATPPTPVATVNFYSKRLLTLTHPTSLPTIR